MAKSVRRRRRERTLGAATRWGLAVSLGLTVLVTIIQLLIPTSALHNFYELVLYNSTPTLATTDIYQHYSNRILREEVFYVSPLAWLCGGLTLGRLAPRRAGEKTPLWAAVRLAVGTNLVLLLLLWGSVLVSQRGRLAPHQIDAQLVFTQTFLVLVWALICAGGAWLGLRWRDRSVGHEAEPAEPLSAAGR